MMPLPQFTSQWQALPNAKRLAPFAIIDSAQAPQLLATLKKKWPAMQSLGLLPDAHDPKLANVMPHLATLPPFAPASAVWRWLLAEGAAHPAAMTLFASTQSLQALHTRLAAFTEIRLPDATGMFFAFWDPAILGTLVGQADDRTLHVPGPVLTVRQQSRLLDGIAAWWYWSRQGQSHLIEAKAAEPGAMEIKFPLQLAQVQVDMLVEAAVPDQLLANVMMNQPQLLSDIAPAQHYPVVEKLLLGARKLGLRGMQDMTNYICAGLILGDKMQTDPATVTLLQKVKNKEISFSEAMDQF